MNATLAALHQSGHLRRVDRALGEWLARSFPDAAPEIALAGALAARAVGDGHSALALGRAQDWLEHLGDNGQAVALPAADTWTAALQRTPAVCAQAGEEPGAALAPLVLDAQGHIYLRRYFGYERQLATALAGRAGLDEARSPIPDPRSSPSDLDPQQQRAIDIALTRHLTLVTGGPGTGKTHVVVRMLAALAEAACACGAPLRIALAAPTGKAAARLGESVRTEIGRLGLAEAASAQLPRDARTLHTLLGISPWRTQPRFDPTMPLPYDVVVVDEVSMVDLPLMARLVGAVPHDARLILLGDPGQLAAIEAGNVLGALVEATTDGPLRASHVALTHNHRFAPGSSVAALAGAITTGDADAALAALARDASASLAGGTAAWLSAAVEMGRAVAAAADPAAALRAAGRFRVLTALRQGPAGCIALDQAIATRLQRDAGVGADSRWWHGRLLLVTANRPELDLYNGDTGVVWRRAGATRVWFAGQDGTPHALAPAALPPHEGAFALTVHKAQGSEFDRVALVTGPDSTVLTRELLYTGVTRARAAITLCSTPTVLRAGIARRTLRMTGLADRVREAARAPDA